MNLQQIGQMLSEQQESTSQQGPTEMGQAAMDPCGPEPPRPTYFSPDSVRKRHMAWQMCKSGA